MTTRQGVERLSLGLTVLALSSIVVLPARQAAAIPESLFEGMAWRPIGPMRAGRTCAVAGHPSHPFTFYIGVCNGGVWKTTDAGTTWLPIFDDQPTQSIGALAIAPSNPNIIYVGSGEGLHRPDLSVGDGLYRSADAGKTWTPARSPRCATDSEDRRRPAQPRSPVRRGARSSVRPESRARHLPIDRRREDAHAGLDPRRRISARATSTSIHRTRTSSTRRSGKIARARGRTRRGAGRAAACSSRPTAATTWRPLTNGLPAGLLHAEITIAPSKPRRLYALVAGRRRRWTRRRARAEAAASSTDRTTPARRGRNRRPTTAPATSA